MNTSLKNVSRETDFCVIGGGMAGMLASISAARHGAKVVLIQDRPVLGGNASSEIRMWIRGAHGAQNKETGILSEIELENIYRNSTLNFSLWDSVLFGMVKAEPNITLLLNCSCADATVENGKIISVTAWQLTTYTWHTIFARYFADCSGDSILAPLTGAKYTKGREAAAQYKESIEPETSDSKTMGMTCMMQARETDHKVDFVAPAWAHVYNTHEEMNHRGHDVRNENWWWMELGGEADSIHDTEELRDELLKIAFGIWDHIKNKGDHGADNFELDWVGFLPGKRESIRYIGDYVLTQNDVSDGGHFDDLVAYGGWSMDDHNPAGFHHNGAPTIFHPAPSPYGIPYRSLYSVNIDNLFFAGRNISASHAALSSTRVMATCAVIGQAMGTAAAICVANKLSPREVYQTKLSALQTMLLDDGCFLPYHARRIPECSKNSSVNLSTEQKEILFNGIERPNADMTDNKIVLEKGSSIDFKLTNPEQITSLRIVFDFDFIRQYEKNGNHKRFPMKCATLMDFEPLIVPKTLVKAFTVMGTDEKGTKATIFETTNNYQHILHIPVEKTLTELSIRFDSTWGATEVSLYSCDFV